MSMYANPDVSWHWFAAAALALLYLIYRMHRSRQTQLAELAVAMKEIEKHRLGRFDDWAVQAAQRKLAAGARAGGPAGVADVRRALELGAKIDAVDPGTSAPAIYTAAQKGHADVVQILIESGANLDATNRDGISPISAATRCLSISPSCGDCISLLLKAGAIVDVADSSGNSALHAACRANMPDIVGALVRGGGSVDAVNDAGDTPASLAAVHKSVDLDAALASASRTSESPDDNELRRR